MAKMRYGHALFYVPIHEHETVESRHGIEGALLRVIVIVQLFNINDS